MYFWNVGFQEGDWIIRAGSGRLLRPDYEVTYASVADVWLQPQGSSVVLKRQWADISATEMFKTNRLSSPAPAWVRPGVVFLDDNGYEFKIRRVKGDLASLTAPSGNLVFWPIPDIVRVGHPNIVIPTVWARLDRDPLA